MNLFEKLPENFFSILVSKNKNIYIDALFVLGEAFKQEMTISKDNLVSRLINSLEEEFNREDFSEDEDADELKDNNCSSKAYFLLRKLKNTGWIEVEMQRDSFEENVILPEYSIKFINFLYSIVEENQIEFNSYVFSTYTGLNYASKEKNETYNAINTAYNNTILLVNELKTLYNSIGRYHKKMCNKDNINDIVKEHFQDYKEYSDEMIFPRFTRDSVPRYKAPIRDMLNNILADKETLNNTINIAFKNKKYKDYEEAENDILMKIRTVLEVYENIDTTMNKIEDKNTDYVRASVHRIQYLLTNDKELKGKLVSILKNSKDEKVLQKMEEEVKLLKQEYVCKDSIYIRNSNDKRKQGTPLAISSEKVNDMKALEAFAKSVENLYSNKKINEFMEKNFKGKPFINSSEIELKNTEDIVLLILATIKANNSNKSFYYMQDSTEIIDNNGYKIPNIKFIRRS